MKKLFLQIALLLPAAAQAHPGHGKPGFLHAHSASELMDWVANGALALYAVAVFGAACWGAARLWNRHRRNAKRDRR